MINAQVNFICHWRIRNSLPRRWTYYPSI